MLPVVVCNESVKKRRMSIDSNGTIDTILPFEDNSEDDSPERTTATRNNLPMHASLKPRKPGKQKRGSKSKKEKARKRPSISSEGTIIEDLGLSGGQSLSENMQQQENGDFSGKNEYATANAREILPKKSETFQESLMHTGKIGVQCQKEFELNRFIKVSENEKEPTNICKSVTAGIEDTNLPIPFLEDKITYLQQR